MNEVPTQEEVNVFLDALRESGAVNMFGAGSSIQQQFDVTKYEANRFLQTWMTTFDERQNA